MVILIQFEKKPLLFQNPVKIISSNTPDSLGACFIQMEQALKSGYYLAGFISYEAGYSFEQCLHDDRHYDFPLLHMGVYKQPAVKLLQTRNSLPKGAISDIHLNITKERYFHNIAVIRDHIAKGDVYQITYCIKLLFDYCGDPCHLYSRLLKEQAVPYPAYIETDDYQILSLSPEKFLKKNAGSIISKPMKGTWPRAFPFARDLIERLRFCRDKKNRAENVMIADLLRNDLGRIGRNVKAPKLFEVAGYKTLYQMTSTVTAEMDKDLELRRLLGALFPSGSVTGAPKIRAMEIIRSLELEERRIYTGAIGYITPRKDLFFNIPIRTLLLRNGRGEMGIGGGIVWDSTPEGEWAEGLLKASFVTDLFSARRLG